MKIILSMDLDIEGVEIEAGKKLSDEEVKEELTQMLFEVCEEWVLKGQVPELEFK